MGIEQRHLPDRRSKPTRCFSRFTLTGRRKAARRHDEDLNYYVDRHGWRSGLVFGLTLVLCLSDFWLTLRIHELGGSEVNWLAVHFLGNHRLLLLLLKFGLTLAGLAFLILHKNFRVLGLFRTRDAVYLIFAVYLILTSYELYGVLAVDNILFAP
jgi:hypothetical protein